MKDTIAMKEENIILGETEFPIQQIIHVEAGPIIPRRLVLLGFALLATFVFVATSMAAVGLSSIFTGTANSPLTSSMLAIIFSVGGALMAFITIYGTLAYPIEWQVRVFTPHEIHVVFADTSRTRATIYARRIRTAIQRTKKPLAGI
jgi:hypothetical protein